MGISFNTILSEVSEYLDQNLPRYLSYHDKAHTMYVLEKAIYIAQKEGLNDEDIELIKIAALYHDIGFTSTHVEHEKEGCIIASQKLVEFGFSKEQIELVCGMIMATRIPQQPQNHMEAVLADADLEYLGTSKYKKMAHNLFKELRHYNPKLTENEWRNIQINFMKEHHYHTQFCRRYKSFRKQKNLECLLENNPSA